MMVLVEEKTAIIDCSSTTVRIALVELIRAAVVESDQDFTSRI
jgi:hypothetical protein